MPDYVNFYENQKEADMRLRDTIVLYDGEPYYIYCVCDHKSDNILRVYMDKLGHSQGLTINWSPIPVPISLGGSAMDDYLEKNPDTRIIRKMMNSPKFNRFRPFPLGMCNFNGSVQYLERSPTRHTQQGLTESMLHCHSFSFENRKGFVNERIPFAGIEMYDTIMGNYPSARECIEAMQKDDVGGGNKAVAFHRLFAFLRGPLNTFFLAYKDDIIGSISNGDFSSIHIPSEYRHTREVVDSLGIFSDIRA